MRILTGIKLNATTATIEMLLRLQTYDDELYVPNN